MDDVQRALSAFKKADAVRGRWEQVCLRNLPEALFAETVILVEGDDDAAVLQGLDSRAENSMALQGICVAAVGGKDNMMIPFTILKQLDIKTLMMVDNDFGCGQRMRANGKSEDEISKAEAKHRKDNRALCSLVGASEEDYPREAVSGELFFMPDTLESLLYSDLPGWEVKRREIISDGRGVDGKNAATYELAARECTGETGAGLMAVLTFMAA